MGAYLPQIRKLEWHFNGLPLEHVKHCDNKLTDELSQLAYERRPVPVETFEERLAHPSALTAHQDEGVSSCRRGYPGSTWEIVDVA